jgi:hypothetical protein
LFLCLRNLVKWLHSAQQKIIETLVWNLS